MLETELNIINKLGLHARAAAKFVATASRFQCKVSLEKLDPNNRKAGRKVDGKSIMSLLMLAANQGTILRLVTDGNDEHDARDAICELVNNRFDEEE